MRVEFNCESEFLCNFEFIICFFLCGFFCKSMSKFKSELVCESVFKFIVTRCVVDCRDYTWAIHRVATSSFAS